MAQFANYVSAKNDPSYLGLSKEPDRVQPNKGMGKLFEGIGDILEMGLKGADEIQKQSIAKEAEAGFSADNRAELGALEDKARGLGMPIDTVGNASVLRPQSTSGEPIPDNAEPTAGGTTLQRDDSPLPVDAQRGLNNLGRISAGAAAGKVSDTGRQMQGEARLSDLLQRYPNRAAEIRAQAAKYGYGDGRHIAALRADINTTQARIDAKDAKDEAWESKERANILIHDPIFFDRTKESRRAPDFKDSLQQRMGMFESQKVLNDTIQSNLSTKKAQNEDIKGDQEKVWSNKTSLDVGVGLSGIMTSMGYKGNSVTQMIDDWKRDPANQDPKKLQALGEKITQWENTQIAKWNQEALATKVGDKGDTVTSVLGNEKLNKMHKDALEVTSLLKNSLSTERTKANWDFAGAAAAETQAWQNQAAQKAVRDHPILAASKAYRDNLGEQVWNSMYIGAGVHAGLKLQEKLNDAMQLTLAGVTTSVATGANNPQTQKPWIISEVISDYQNRWGINGTGAPKANDMAALMGRIHQNILNPQLPPEIQAKFAKFVFNDPRLLANIKEGERLKFMTDYASPEVGEKIFSINDPELTASYKKFMIDGVSNAMKEAGANIKEAQTKGWFNDPSLFNLKFNPDTNRVDAQVPSTQELVSKYGPARGMFLDYEMGKVRDSVPRINQALGLLEPILKRDGPEQVAPGLMSTIGQLGIKVDIPEALKGAPKALEAPRSGTTAETKAKPAQVSQDTWDHLMNSKDTFTIGGHSFTAQDFKNFLSGSANASTMQPMGGSVQERHPDTGKPIINNPDGSISTERTITVGTEHGFVNIPTIIDGKQVSQEEAIKAYTAGTNPAVGGPYKSIPDAEKAAQERSKSLGKRSEYQGEGNKQQLSFVQPASVADTAPQRAITNATGNPLVSLIRQAEGTKNDVGYNTTFGGRQFPLTDMSVNEVIALQSGLPKDQRASGVGQFMPETLKSLKKDLGLTGDEKMTPKLQHELIDALLERRGFSKWKAGEMSDERFAGNLAKEWAGLPHPLNGKSFYDGIAGNRATVSLDDLYGALTKLKSFSEGTPANVVRQDTNSERAINRLEEFNKAGMFPKINKENWDKMLKETPPSTNVEDRRSPESEADYKRFLKMVDTLDKGRKLKDEDGKWLTKYMEETGMFDSNGAFKLQMEGRKGPFTGKYETGVEIGAGRGGGGGIARKANNDNPPPDKYAETLNKQQYDRLIKENKSYTTEKGVEVHTPQSFFTQTAGRMKEELQVHRKTLRELGSEMTEKERIVITQKINYLTKRIKILEE